MHAIKALIRIVCEFGMLGWCEVIAAAMVATGCLGELWLILNKLTKHVEPLPKNVGSFWKVLYSLDSIIRPLILRFKIKGRKISEAKEQLLERLFVSLVGMGVAMELICLMFSLHEVAKLNTKASQAEEVAAKANERAAELQSDNLVLSNRLAVTKKRVDLIKGKIRSRSLALNENIDEFLKRLGWWPKTKVLIVYPKEDIDSWKFANALENALSIAKWDVTGIRPIREDDSLSQYVGMTNAPLFIRTIGPNGSMGLVLKSRMKDPFWSRKNDNAYGALVGAISAIGVNGVLSFPVDPRLPDDVLEIIIGPDVANAESDFVSP